MSTFKIPSRFKLFGQTIEVVYDTQLDFRHGARGQTRYRENRILLQSDGDQHPTMPCRVEQTFFHELVHWIFYYVQNDKQDKLLDDDERLVDNVAALLHQAITTMEYDDDPT